MHLRQSAKRLARRASHFLYFRNLAFERHVTFLGGGKIYFDPDDVRGGWFRKNAGLTQPGVTGLWRSANRLLKPELILDIGANYGEVALSATYSQPCTIVLFEANPNLAGLLRRSIAAHPNRANIRLEECAASDRAGTLTFHINCKNSGRSSARSVSGADWQEIAVPSKSVESCLGGTNFKSVLFKIDVEGFEGYVLRGMHHLLRSGASFVGIIEFSRHHLDAARFGADDFVRYAREFGALAYLDRHNALHRISDSKALPDHTDLVLASSDDFLDRISVSRWVRAR